MQALADALIQNKALQKLFLNENSVGPRGAAVLGAALTKNQKLNTLWLSNNNIGDDGAAELATALRSGSSLEVLDLWNNAISPAGARAIAEALPRNHRLRTLELRGNAIGDAGAVALAEVMSRNRALSTLDIVSNAISKNGTTAILAGLRCVPSSLAANPAHLCPDHTLSKRILSAIESRRLRARVDPTHEHLKCFLLVQAFHCKSVLARLRRGPTAFAVDIMAGAGQTGRTVIISPLAICASHTVAPCK
jgi:hypothetical protein